MALLQIPLNQIAEADLTRLIATKAIESRYIDYKRDTFGNADRDRAEIRADITSFANAAGGDLVIGMSETGGFPTAIVPYMGDVEAEKLRLEGMVRSGIEPPLLDISIASIAISTGGHVLLVRAPRSYSPPHRVTFNGGNRFWARSSAGKYEPNVEELRHLFTAGAKLADRIRFFHSERIRKIISAPPVPIPGGPLFVIHVVPYSAFDPLQLVPIAQLENSWQRFVPPGRTSPSDRTINFDGLLTLANFNRERGVFHAYAQVFRTGIVEGLAFADSNGLNIRAASVDRYAVHSTRAYLDGLSALGLEPPFGVLVSLVRVPQHIFAPGIDGLAPPFNPMPIDRNILTFNEVVVQSRPLSNTQCAEALRIPFLQQLWNAAGFLEPQTINRGKYLWGP